MLGLQALGLGEKLLVFLFFFKTKSVLFLVLCLATKGDGGREVVSLLS